jgi:hypothetical protein
MRILVRFVGLIGVLSACSKSTEICEICGEYKLLNFSKVEVNQLNTPLMDLTIRRNIYLNQQIGTDEYSLCSWNSQKPADSWSSHQQKEIMEVNGDLKISQNGKWFWRLTTKEKTRFTQLNKTFTSTTINKTVEEGTWKQVYQSNLEFTIHKQENRSEKIEEIAGKSVKSIVYQNEIKSIADNRANLFEVAFDRNQNQIGLKTRGETANTLSYHPEKSLYSLIGGSVWMNLSRVSPQSQLAHYRVK